MCRASDSFTNCRHFLLFHSFSRSLAPNLVENVLRRQKRFCFKSPKCFIFFFLCRLILLVPLFRFLRNCLLQEIVVNEEKVNRLRWDCLPCDTYNYMFKFLYILPANKQAQEKNISFFPARNTTIQILQYFIIQLKVETNNKYLCIHSI